ncbi:hypothetical protein ACEPAG_7981 [Sanghuangporus baumii]
MPAFQNFIQAGRKRPHALGSDDLESRKRQITGLVITDVDGTSIANDVTKAGEQYWIVQWRHPQSKKHKTWEGDGVLVLFKGKGVLYDMDGSVIASGKPSPDGACIGTFLQLGSKEMEVDCSISKAEFMSGRVFGKGTVSLSNEETSARPIHTSLKKKFTPLKPVSVNGRLPQPQYPVSRKEEIALEPVELIQNIGDKTSICSAPWLHWSAHWRRPQGRKHKTWDGDSYIVLSGDKLIMVSDDGKLMGSTKWKGGPLREGTVLYISSKTVELENRVGPSDIPKIIGTMPPDRLDYDECDVLETACTNEDYSDSTEHKISPLTYAEKENIKYQNDSLLPSSPGTKQKRFVAPANFYGTSAPTSKPMRPLHDPKAEGSVVMKEPTKEHQKKFNSKSRPVVPVVIDPILSRHLRPHQKEGVKFMYECVMGLRKHEGQGCILADEMGMGKTLQTITLVWTLLKQNCYAGGIPSVGKILIVCPVSLIVNWKKEFHKWLGKDRIGVFTGDKSKEAVKQFINSRIHHVLIIGYERLRSVISELSYCIPPIGLIICDEGHRLKSANNKTSKMFEILKTPRRIILSGTPIQNDLSEFHAMADFCNPGLLDDYSTFRKVFENPILKSRAPGCSAKELEIGKARQAHLQAIAKSFVLRRDAGILSSYLPPKHEYVVFVTPSPLQRMMFTKILQPDTLSSLLRGSMARSLAMIQLLIKLSTTPILLRATLEKRTNEKRTNSTDEDTQGSFDEAMKLLPCTAQPQDVELSGKLQALSKLLAYLRRETEEKCILVSHYTSTLNVVEEICKKRKYTFLRLDGQTPTAKRQEYVDRFNKAPQSGAFIFLLSAKAGGVGLNLIGASRLCLVDSDWNPSHDLQSMARIHRDGQKRPVFIYRFLTAGTIDEKIYQRQVTKLGLSDSLMGISASGAESSKSDSFTHDELRDLFTFHHRTSCHTHELIGCPCVNVRESDIDENGLILDEVLSEADSEEFDIERRPQELGFRKASLHDPEELEKIDKVFIRKKKAELASLGEWKHINCLDHIAKGKIIDEALQNVAYIPHNSTSTPDQVDVAAHSLPDDVPGGSICFLFERSSEKS